MPPPGTPIARPPTCHSTLRKMPYAKAKTSGWLPPHAANVGLAIFAVLTVAHGASLLLGRNGGTGFNYADEPTRIGREITSDVLAWDSTASWELSDLRPGQCRLVVIASSICPFCKEAAVRWTVTGLQRPEDLELPNGWQAFWVFIEPGEPVPEFTDPSFPVQRYFASDNASFMVEAGVVAFPYHVVLNRDGTVIQAARGAPLPGDRTPRSDCTLATEGQEGQE